MQEGSSRSSKIKRVPTDKYVLEGIYFPTGTDFASDTTVTRNRCYPCSKFKENISQQKNIGGTRLPSDWLLLDFVTAHLHKVELCFF